MRTSLFALLALVLVACSVDPSANPNRCAADGTCPGGATCVRPDGLREDEPGFCISAMDAGPFDAGPDDAGPTCTLGTNTDCGSCGDACTGQTPVCREADDGVFACACRLGTEDDCTACGLGCEPPNPLCQATAGGGFACTRECDSEEPDVCNGGCVDRDTSLVHCGSCDNECAMGEMCDGGQCRCGDGEPCRSFETCCDGACVNLDTSEAQCGACGSACAAGADCMSGRCVCNGDTTTDCRDNRACRSLSNCSLL